MTHRSNLPLCCACVPLLFIPAPTFSVVPDFQPTYRAFAIASGPPELQVLDMNGDGHMDIVAGGWQAASILLGNADGLFSGSVLPAGSQPRSLAAADFDGDGQLDLAAAEAGTATIWVLFGNGGLFTAGPTRGGFTGVDDVRAADFNGDGHADLAVTNGQSTGKVAIVLGNGDGTFSEPVNHDAGNTPRDLETADLNGDGHLDVVAGSSVTGIPAITVLLGDGNGFFAPPAAILTGYRTFELVLADFDGDADRSSSSSASTRRAPAAFRCST